MPRDARFPSCPARFSVFLGLGLGVLLYGCTRRSGDPARALPSVRSAPALRRVGTHVASKSGAESVTYAVKLDAALTRLDVEVCPSGFRIERLNAPSPGAQTLLAGGHVVTLEGDVPCADEGVDLPSTKTDECVSYAVDLPQKSSDPTALRRVDADVLASPDLWLWVPTPRPEGASLRVHFDLPPGVIAAVPWQNANGDANGDANGTEFSLPESAFAWKSAGAFSHAPIEQIELPQAKLRLATLGAGFGAGSAAVREWIVQGARTSSLLFGHFPVARALVIAVPVARSGPSFGMALRGGGPAVVILLKRDANAATLADDWTATHEFLHLGVPRLPPEDSWLFEGLATYYTELTRARAGIITPKQAYQHLLEGFERSRRGGGSSLTLREESAQMRERHSFYRVYWAGAAIAFLADVAARRAGTATLDGALRSFAECCASSEREATADSVLAALAAFGATRLTTEAQRWLDSKEFPDVDEALRTLGVTFGGHGAAVFGRAPNAAIRDAIMARSALP